MTPDFQGNLDLVDTVIESGLDVYAHNIETVERLTPRVRDRRAGYQQTLRVLEHVKNRTNSANANNNAAAAAAVSLPLTKSSIMLGLGETDEDLRQTLLDLRNAGVDVVTLGQYLQPTKRHLPVQRYVPPEEYEEWQRVAEEMGFLYVASGPLVRSSYKAGEFFLKNYLLKHQQQEQQQLMQTG